MDDSNMNNGNVNSNTPYKAVRNLNTVIGNPDINVNSVTTSNILEDNNTQSNFVPANDLSNTSTINENSDSSVKSVNSIDSGDDINKYINSLNSNTEISSASVESSNEPINSSTDDSPVITEQPSQVNDTIASKEVVYENAYQTKSNKKGRKKIAIPSEFRTAIIIVLVLLAVITCFEPIYDFFRNLFTFG